MIDLDAELPSRSPRALPRKIPAGSHVLSHSDLRAIARHFVGRDNAALGEELIPHILHHSLFGAETGRVIPRETLAALDPDGNRHTGKRILVRFLQNIRRGDVIPQPDGHHAQPYARGGAVGKVSKESVNYRQAEDNQFCARCTMFRQPASCTAVEGRIHRVDLCDLYEQA